jgi:hypothetical protein
LQISEFQPELYRPQAANYPALKMILTAVGFE